MIAKTKRQRNLGWIFLAIGALLAVRMSLNIWKVYRSGGRIGQAQVELEAVQKEQELLKQNLAQVQSPEFIEEEAREKLGMGRPGEVILIMPKFDDKPSVVEIPALPNWRQWWNLYAGI